MEDQIDNTRRQKLTIHPLALLFPEMTGVEFERFMEDISIHGQREPIVLLDGQILDGRNRFRACLQLGIIFKTVEWDGLGSPAEFVLSKNLHRRQLTAGQRAAVALHYLGVFEGEAKMRQRAGSFKARRRQAKSRELVGKLFAVSGRYVSDAKRLKTDAPDLFKGVWGGWLALSSAMLQLKRRAGESRIRGTRLVATDLHTGASRSIVVLNLTPEAVLSRFAEGGDQ